MPIDLNKLPRHVAIIMDGNGRWAQEHGLPRVEGHRQGAKAVREVVRAAREIGLGALTLYALLGFGVGVLLGRLTQRKTPAETSPEQTNEPE